MSEPPTSNNQYSMVGYQFYKYPLLTKNLLLASSWSRLLINQPQIYLYFYIFPTRTLQIQIDVRNVYVSINLIHCIYGYKVCFSHKKHYKNSILNILTQGHPSKPRAMTKRRSINTNSTLIVHTKPGKDTEHPATRAHPICQYLDELLSCTSGFNLI